MFYYFFHVIMDMNGSSWILDISSDSEIFSALSLVLANVS